MRKHRKEKKKDTPYCPDCGQHDLIVASHGFYKCNNCKNEWDEWEEDPSYRKKKPIVEELMGCAHMPNEEEQNALFTPEIKREPKTEEEITDAWIYSLSAGEGWDVVNRENGTLTVRKKDVI